MGSKASGGGGSYVREASHAGSWYSGQRDVLSSQLDGWLDAAGNTKGGSKCGPVRAIISPHAGYSYSGPTAAYAFSQLDASKIQRVFILGPSHHVYLRACAVSGATVCETPVGDLQVDDDVRRELLRTKLFEVMRQSVDEDEHSIEMQLPYIAQAVKGRNVKIVPIMVGAIDPDQEEQYGRLLAPYLEDPSNFFVISSDFCHWGSRFRYQPYDKSHGDICEYIEWLDRLGMALIEARDCEGFTDYLRKHQNTICGRHPIGVLLQAIRACTNKDFSVRFVRYAQSNRCKNRTDSSVSYASAVVEEAAAGNCNDK